ncbi:Cysteine--tRNA ligase [Nymphon striatum]|nr:Cysteine--tRNA ligase [Nymphon striatum]
MVENIANKNLRLYNTLSRQKETFEPIDPNNVRMYVCGPTVYDFAHIGNARPVIVFDVLYRLLRHIYGEEHVTYVRNITDVDDKINAHMAALGCLAPTHEPRATDFVLPRGDKKTDMATIIQNLLDKDHAYIATGDEGREVLFDVTSMSNYGVLSNRKLEDQQAGARIEAKSHKKNAGDFVLWKESFSMVQTRSVVVPGWHIECSAMSAAYLGTEFDIHGGGLDLIFPHHENEIAQSCCAHGTDKMANVWMHNGYLQVEGKKMSKSLGNFITVHELMHTDKFGGRKWPGEVLRLAMLMTHYREPIDFTVKRLEEAKSIYLKLADAINQAQTRDQTKWKSRNLNVIDNSEILSLLRNDLNTPAAINQLSRLANSAKKLNADDRGLLEFALELIGFDRDKMLSASQFAQSFDLEVQPQIDARLAAIANKDWAEADRIRDELLAQGIQLKDSKDFRNWRAANDMGSQTLNPSANA